MVQIPVQGLATNDPVPGNYVAVNFAQGQAASGQTDYSVLLLGNCLSGSVVSSSFGASPSTVFGATTPTPADTEQDFIDLFGAGSELHRMQREFRRVNQSTSLFAIAVPESTGAKATGLMLFSGTATANATVRCWIEDVQIDSSILKDDTAGTIATNLVAAINQFDHLPVVASVSGVTGSLLTAKQKGLRGNDIRFSAKILPSTNTGVTVSPTTRTLMTNGTTSDSITTTLAAIASDRFYYYVPAAKDQTQLDAIADQIDSMAAPIPGLRQRLVAGSNDSSPSNVQTIAIALNNPRCEIVHQLDSDWSPCRLAAHAAACYTQFESSLGAPHSLNYNSFGADAVTSAVWKVPPALSGNKLSRAQVKSHLMNGVTPITQTAQGLTYLVRRITTKSLNGSAADYRVRDACKVTVSDRWADDLLAQLAARGAGKVIGNDPAPGQRMAGPSVFTPRDAKAIVFDLIDQYDNSDLLQDVEASKDGVVVIRETSPSNRISMRVPLKVIDILNQVATNVDEVSSG